MTQDYMQRTTRNMHTVCPGFVTVKLGLWSYDRLNAGVPALENYGKSNLPLVPHLKTDRHPGFPVLFLAWLIPAKGKMGMLQMTFSTIFFQIKDKYFY